MIFKLLVVIAALTAGFATVAVGQMPAIEPGVSLELAKWRAVYYSDVRYKLDLTLEKMSPVLKGTMEIRVNVNGPSTWEGGRAVVVLDWRKIRGSEKLSTLANVTVNGKKVVLDPNAENFSISKNTVEGEEKYFETNEHLIFYDAVNRGENVIKLDFTSPILTSGSAITRYIDKEDGSEYIYSLFVPSDASTAFPVFDQPDLKARFSLTVMKYEKDWTVISNTGNPRRLFLECSYGKTCPDGFIFPETKPISTYVFAFAAGPFERVDGQSEPPAVAGGFTRPTTDLSGTKSSPINAGATRPNVQPPATAGGTDSTAGPATAIYVRKSQAVKFKPHAAEVFRLHREGIKFLESYFDYKFPFPKYDVVLIPEFPFGGMEHAGATFLREASVIFPQEPTKNDYINRATLIFHEAAHQWFGDTVTMRWFDDLWLKEGFATFMGYKALEKVMPEYNAWKVFYERVKQAAYQTDSTKGTTPIYQEIKNLSAAKSAYGNIVYNKAPAFLRQAEFYLGEDKFQTAVRAFLKKHEYANAGWEDLVKEFELVNGQNLGSWATAWVKKAGVPVARVDKVFDPDATRTFIHLENRDKGSSSPIAINILKILTRKGTREETRDVSNVLLTNEKQEIDLSGTMIASMPHMIALFPNYKDYGYGIFLFDTQSRDYVLKNIGDEKDDFLRSMMWGALWDSVREAEMDPREYVELVIKNLSVQSSGFSRPNAAEKPAKAGTLNGETDESTIQTLLGRVSTAMRYYIDAGGSAASVPPAVAGGALSPGKKSAGQQKKTPPATAGGTDLQARLEALLIDRMQNAPTPGQKITYYRSFLSLASSDNARRIMKEILKKSMTASIPASVPPAVAGGASTRRPQTPPATAGGTDKKSDAPAMSVTTKDKFDIVSRLIILGDPDAPKLLAELEKTETSDDAKRYAYAAKAGFATAENKAKFWNDFVNNKDISESWIEAAFGPFNNVRHSSLTLPYLERALASLPDHKRNRKIFFVNGWLGAFIGGQKSEEALKIVNDFLAKNPDLDKDLRLKILENVDVIERAVKIRARFAR